MVFEALFPQFDFSDERIQTIVGIFETNAIEIRLAQSEVQALYETGCLLEHSCLPNLRMTFDDKFNVSYLSLVSCNKYNACSLFTDDSSGRQRHCRERCPILKKGLHATSARQAND